WCAIALLPMRAHGRMCVLARAAAEFKRSKAEVAAVKAELETSRQAAQAAAATVATNITALHGQVRALDAALASLNEVRGTLPPRRQRAA
ncbi:hypothetical protein OFN33_28675, partial [Escherichia coli]|nr:hypothetical protein [Escherichia coli]